MNEKALYKIFYGMYIVSSFDNEKLNGQIANTVFQLTAEPPLLGVSINKENLTHLFIEKSKIFTVSVLAKEAPMKFIGLFGFRTGREVNKFENVNYKVGSTGAPVVLDNTVAYMEAKVVNQVDCGTHTIFIGEVVEADILSDEDPMTYAYYREVKNGKSPKNAPTYMKEKSNTSDKRESVKYRCTVCGYIYDPEKGDPDSNIKPGTPFEELPDSWRCPVCGVDKTKFEKMVK